MRTARADRRPLVGPNARPCPFRTAKQRRNPSRWDVNLGTNNEEGPPTEIMVTACPTPEKIPPLLWPDFADIQGALVTQVGRGNVTKGGSTAFRQGRTRARGSLDTT